MNRTASKSKQFAAGLRNSGWILLLGLLLGAVGRWSAYHAPFLAELASGIPLWILLGCLVSLGSRSSWRAGCNVFLLLGGMVCASYFTTELMSAPQSWKFLAGWGAAAVFSPVPGFFVWYARGGSLQAWILRLGVLAFQTLAMLAASGGARLLNMLLIAATAAVLLWDKAVERRPL